MTHMGPLDRLELPVALKSVDSGQPEVSGSPWARIHV